VKMEREGWREVRSELLCRRNDASQTFCDLLTGTPTFLTGIQALGA
jgi:hypothetical protein